MGSSPHPNTTHLPQRTAPLVHGELPERTYAKLRDLIIRGRLAPGTRAVETELARRFGISRTPLRESLARLAREGYLVPATRGRRTELVVAPLATAAVAELWGIIGALEGFAIQAVGQMSDEERATLVSDLEQVNADLAAAATARPRDNDVVFELQSAFHVCFMERCAGPHLRMLYDSVRPHVQRYEWAYGTQSDAPYTPSIAEHREIIATIVQGDPRAAREALERHWANGVKRTSALIARFCSQSGGAAEA
jgi:DNA-binding GntR family transcriptional regulator